MQDRSNKKMIYFAGPLFNIAERTFNEKLTDALESCGYEVFLSQRDGVDAKRAPYSRMSKLNLMIHMALDAITTSIYELLEYIRDELDGIEGPHKDIYTKK